MLAEAKWLDISLLQLVSKQTVSCLHSAVFSLIAREQKGLETGVWASLMLHRYSDPAQAKGYNAA